MSDPQTQPEANEIAAPPPRNLVICLDGTNNEPERDVTNVARLFHLASKDATQLVYYDPGVGTMGSRGAVTRFGKGITRVTGLIVGFGIKDNIEEAYSWLAEHYRKGDQVFVFGFSRGAYTARALTGMLGTVGLLRPGAQNLLPYALKLYTKSLKDAATEEETDRFWKVRRDFDSRFGNPDFPSLFSGEQIRFLGVWDTVKTVGWLNWKAQFEQAQWPFTADIRNVQIARHAMAIDEKRAPYPVNRFSSERVANSRGRYQEMWFAGIHSDVGGQYDDHRLSDIAFAWMMKEAVAAGLRIKKGEFTKLMKFRSIDPIPDALAEGEVHTHGRFWWLTGGWRARRIQPGDELHPSVHTRIAATAGKPKPYSPKIP